MHEIFFCTVLSMAHPPTMMWSATYQSIWLLAATVSPSALFCSRSWIFSASFAVSMQRASKPVFRSELSFSKTDFRCCLSSHILNPKSLKRDVNLWTGRSIFVPITVFFRCQSVFCVLRTRAPAVGSRPGPSPPAHGSPEPVAPGGGRTRGLLPTGVHAAWLSNHFLESAALRRCP